MAISKLNKLLNTILDTKNAVIGVGPRVVKISTAAKVYGDDPTVTPYNYTGLAHQTRDKTGVMELLRADPDWVSVATTQRKDYKKTVNYAFKNEKHNAVIYVRSILSMSHTGKQSLSQYLANVYYVVGASKLNDLWLVADDVAVKQKADRKAAKTAEQEMKITRNKNWVGQILHEKDHYNVPSMADFRACLWVNLMGAVQANAGLWNFSELLAKSSRKPSDQYYLARRGLKTNEMTSELTKLFLDSTFHAIETIATASQLKATRNGNTITLSNSHTREHVNMQLGVFTGHNTYIKVG